MTAMNQQNSLLGKIAAYTEILAKDPTSTIFVSLSEAYRKMGMLDEARKVVEKGLESHVDFSPAYIVLARILCQQGKYAASESAFQKALEYDSESLAALVGYARLNILLGQESKAREVLLAARKLSPADPVINKLLLSLPEEVVEEAVEEVPEEAVEEVLEEETPVVAEEAPQEVVEEETATEAAEISTAPSLASSTLAELYLKQGLIPQALDVYRQLSLEAPDNLLFRRKIRDIEDGLLGTEQKPAPEAEQIQSIQEQTGRVAEELSPDVEADGSPAAEDSEFIKPEEVVAPTVEIAAEKITQSADDKVVAVLNSWLDSIQQRREDV